MKTLSAHRVVPLHPILLKLGLIEAIEQQGFEPRDWVWPGMPREQKKVGAFFARFWSVYRNDAGIDDPRKTFHSFRHTFIHALAEVEPRFEIVADIAGHFINSDFYGRYRKRADARLLFRSIKRIKFPNSIDHLLT